MPRYIVLLACVVLCALRAPAQSNPPTKPPAPTILDQDTEFAAGSRIKPQELTSAQSHHLALLGRVWGFLKYHHPAVTSGRYHWDFELIRILPAVLEAKTDADTEAVLAAWIDRLGPLGPVVAESTPSADRHLAPDLRWLEGLSPELRAKLQAVHAARAQSATQFYLGFVPHVGNPVFAHELTYSQLALPDAGYQLLALFRYWNIIRYWFPYRDLIDEDWDRTLEEFVPRFAAARDVEDYHLALLALMTRVSDTHSNLWSDLAIRPPVGGGRLPIVVRFIEGRPVVTAVLAADPSSDFQIGDVLVAIDGRPVAELIKEWSPYYAASNEPTRLRDIARTLGRGAIGPVEVMIERAGARRTIAAVRVDSDKLPVPEKRNDRDGPAFKKLGPDIAYFKLSTVTRKDTESYVQQALGAKGWIIDARNYPSDFPLYALGGHLVAKTTDFFQVTKGNAANPGEFIFKPGDPISPLPPHYPGRVVILVDEITQSSAEFHTMAFRAAPGAIVIGSTTAAADGNISAIPLPGNQRSVISGIGIFYADRRPTQRIGIIPDIVCEPTLAGIQAGRDEVLETALRQILGPETPADTIRSLAAPPEAASVPAQAKKP